MSDAITIRIEGDASGATTAVKGTANAADQLGRSLTVAGESGEVAGNEIAEGMQKAEYSMMEARHAAMMLGEETGIRIPRALAGIAARSEALGPILAAAFSGIALIAFVELAAKGIEKLEKWIEDTFIFTEAMRTIEGLNKAVNQDIEDQDKKLKSLKEAYDLIGLTGSALTGKKFEFFNADELAPAEAKLKEVGNAVGYIRGGFDSLGNAVSIANAQITGFNQSLPKDKQVPLLPSNTTEQQAVTALLEIQGAYQKNVATLQQEGANRQKEYEDQATEEAKKAAAKRLAIELKMQEAIGRSHQQLTEELNKDDEQSAKLTEEQLKSQLELELKSGEAILKAGDAELKLNAEMAKAATEAQADVVAKDKAAGLTARALADEQVLVQLLQQQEAAELAVVDAKMAEAQAAMDVAKASGPGGGLNVADYNNALAQYRDYQTQRIQIAATADKQIQAATDAEIKQDTKEYQQYLQTFNNAFATAFANVELGHETMGREAMKVYDEMATAFLKNMAIAAMAELEGLALHKTIAAQKQLSDAKGAAGGAYNATVDIPVIGPVLAPIAAATAFAAVMAFDEGGMVPQTQMALVHSGESVLTPQQTDNFKQMTENGGGGDTHNYGDTHIHAMDASSFQSFLKKNPGALSAGINHAAKNGHLSVSDLARGK